MEQESRSNGASATSSKQSADNTSRIESVHISGLLALNPAPVEKTDVPSKSMSPLSAWTAKINAMDTGMPSRASSSCSEFSTPSVADSVEFTETNPEALRGLGLGIDASDKEASGNATKEQTTDEDLAWGLCNMEQQSRSKTTHTTNATNATKDQDAKKTSSIKPVHALGLLALNPGPPSTSSFPFSTPSVADSVEFTETSPAAVIDKEATVKDTQASGDTVMNDTESESDMEQVSTGAVSSVVTQQVCLLIFEKLCFRSGTNLYQS